MSSPSPAVEVKDGAGAYTSVTNGKNVTPGNTVTIHLVSSAGVGPWSVSCVYTDELSDAATVTASLTIDQSAKTATFTAPASGRTYIFKSVVNNGIGPDGTVQASYSTTFGVYTLTAASRRVHAVNEAFESNATYGWVGDINDLIRNPAAVGTPTGTGFTHQTAGVTDAASKLVANADVDAAAAIALSKLAASGTNGNVVQQSAGAIALAAVTLSNANSVTGTLGVGNGGTGLAALGTNVGTFLGTNLATGYTTFAATPSSANLAALVTDETGTGALVLATSPLLVTPTIADSAGGQKYVFAVSDLAADRTVTLPLLTANDTFVFAAFTQTLTNKTLTSPAISDPTISGTITYTSTSMQATGNARGKAYSDIANVQTTNATITSLFTWTILDNACTKVTAEVNGDRSTGAETAIYERKIRIKRNSGTVTMGTVILPTTDEEVSTWDCTINNSTSTGQVQVTGVASVTIDWAGIISRFEVAHA